MVVTTHELHELSERAAGERDTRARPRTGARRETLGDALAANFLGHSPAWYKRTIVAFLVLNPVLLSP